MMYLKKLIALLLMLVAAISLSIANAENFPIIRDEADLLTDAEEAELYLAMKPICTYCIPLFWTTADPDRTDTGTKAMVFQFNKIGEADGITFVIDTTNRMIYIWSSKSICQIITTPVAEEITGNTFMLATQGDYFGCAKESFAEILNRLNAADMAQKHTADEDDHLFDSMLTKLTTGE